MKSKLYPAILALAFLAAGACFAQSPGQQTYKFKFRLISWDSVISDLEFLSGSGKPTPVRILPNGRSSFYEYEGPGPVSFGRMKTGPDGKPVFEEAATVPIKEFGERTLLMFTDKTGSPGSYNVVGLDDSDASLPPGAYRFCNLTSLSLALICGDTTGTVTPRGFLTVRAKTTDSGEVMPLEIRAKTKAGFQRVYSNRWPYGATTRTLVFVYLAPETNLFELKRIHEDAAAIPTPKP
ncbi:MAG: hypothetical protein ACOYM3_23710 [Terrimicrobiaceae bacterium]